ncbi:MAG TPA: D-Ala-D-Ala carboxypeptidase family metallohydrolase [Pyrinomonadaceae bacterium]|jgi:hypothetical protein
MYTIEQYRAGLNLTPEARLNAQITVNFINDVFQSLPGMLRISSTVRTPAKNRAVGGVENSKHLVSRALAVDFVPMDGKFTGELKNALQAVCNRHRFELIVHNVGSGLHYHCEYESGNITLNPTIKPGQINVVPPIINDLSKQQSFNLNSLKPEHYIFGALFVVLLLQD